MKIREKGMALYFTEEELNYIFRHKDYPNEELAYLLKRKPEDIVHAKKELRIDPFIKREWTAEEENFLKQNYRKLTYKQMALQLHRSSASISRHAFQLGITEGKPKQTRGKPWTEKEILYISEHHKDDPKDIARYLDRNESSVLNKLTRLGFRQRNRKGWSEKEDDYLYMNYSTKSYKEIARKLHRTKAAVKGRATKLGIHKFDECISLRELGRLLSVDVNHIRTYWIRDNGLPAKKIPNGSSIYYAVEPEDFWKWVDTHRDIISLQNYARGTLIPEPDNITELFQTTKKVSKKHHQPILPSERRAIVKDYDSGISIPTIAERYGRSKSSIRHMVIGKKGRSMDARSVTKIGELPTA